LTVETKKGDMINQALIIIGEKNTVFRRENLFKRKICGLFPLERIILTAFNAGIRRFVVLAETQLPFSFDQLNTPRLRKYDITWLQTDKGFLQTLEQVEHFTQRDNFLLLHIDYSFDLESLNQALTVEKELKEYPLLASSEKAPGGDNVTTGIWLASPLFFEFLNKHQGELSIRSTEAILDYFVQSGRLGYFYIPNQVWCRIITHRDIRIFEKKLFQTIRKPTDGFFAKYFNKYISFFVSKYLIKTPLHPNQITLMVFGVGVLSAAFIASGRYGFYLVGLFLYKMTSILDGCDGEVAKLKFQTSPLGAWLDTIFDNLTTFFFLLAIAYSNYQANPSSIAYSLGLLALIFYSLAILLLLLRLNLFETTGSIVSINTKFKKGKVSSFLANAVRRDSFTVIYVVAGGFNCKNFILGITSAAGLVLMILSVLEIGRNLLRKMEKGKPFYK
jgi:phosphatidylglycerophosphate synthase